ncbi:uncharacterized protein LOC133902467 isoform X4 [Phragmites australis]|uniref:uncharacterized protein LOC133902467 isoform X4 n=1 Tax=Phragmites australis TaxID=29695 RepID=UPI002D779803|nr:uncharacterized protein LOC133902467 isoform X4 [Phragmites australis]
MDSGWVVLGKSDIFLADLAAAAAAADDSYLGADGSWRRGLHGRAVLQEGQEGSSEALDNAETAEEVVEHIAEVTEKLAANVANSLPEDGTPQKVAVEVEYIAEVVDKDAHKVEAVINKIEALSDQIDAAVEPVIEELENDFKPNTTSSSGSDGQK